MHGAGSTKKYYVCHLNNNIYFTMICVLYRKYTNIMQAVAMADTDCQELATQGAGSSNGWSGQLEYSRTWHRHH